jgi:uncharacterized protein
VDAAADVPDGAWDALLGPDDLFLSARWLRVVEGTAGVPVGYLLQDTTQGITGGLATAVAHESVPWLSGRPDTLLERCVREKLPGAAEVRGALPPDLTATLMPALVCGGRHLGRTRVLMRDDMADAAARLHDIVEAAERLGRERGARCAAFLYVDERDSALREVLGERGYVSHLSGYYSWLPVPPSGLAGYLDTLSAHRARRIRAERRHVKAAGVGTSIEPLSSGLIPRMAELETALLNKYGMAWSPEQSASIFGRILDVFGGDAVVSTARLGGALLGFGLLLRHGDQWYAHRAGFDYAARGSLPLYFEVLYYHPIEVAAAVGITTIHYGTGSAEAKRSRGCLAAEQFAYVSLLHRPRPGLGVRVARPTSPLIPEAAR